MSEPQLSTPSDAAIFTPVTGENYIFTALKSSNWTCHLFGSESLTFTPNEGEVPNWFWRKMQYLAFGNRWEKIDRT